MTDASEGWARRFSIAGGARLLGAGLSFATAVVTSRYLGASGRGAYALAVLIASAAAVLLGQSGTAATYEMRRAREADEDDAAVYRLALLIAFVGGVVGAAISWPLIRLLLDGRTGIAGLVSAGVPLLAVAQASAQLLAARSRIAIWSLLQVAPVVVTLATALVLVGGLDQGLRGAAIAWLAGQAAGVLVALWAARDEPRGQGTALTPQVVRLSSLALRVGVVNMLSLLNYRVELVILKSYSGLREVGIYSVATSVAESVWIASSVVSTLTVSAMVELGPAEAAETVLRICRRITIMATALSLAICAVVVPLLPAIFGSGFASGRLPLLLLLPGIVLFAPGATLALFFSVQHGRTRYPLIASLLSTSVTAATAVPLVAHNGATGAAIACSLGYASGMVLAMVMFARGEGRSVWGFLPRVSDLGDVTQVARRRIGARTVKPL